MTTEPSAYRQQSAATGFETADALRAAARSPARDVSRTERAGRSAHR